jgi:prephenate dehydrogenase
MLIRRLAVIGVGLIGGSLARALRAAGEVGEVVGCGRGRPNLEQAVELGVIDRFSQDIGEAVQGADLVFLAVPLGAMESAFMAMRDRLEHGAVVTDGGSAKGSVVAACQVAFGEHASCFVPGHPIAGTEQSGVAASFPELYRNRRVILTPTELTSRQALTKVEAMWRACGAEITCMSVQYHDEVLAATSHLPHMLAFSLVDSLARLKEHDDIFRYAAGGFRDFTRIASSNPVMWRDICIANRAALSDVMERYIAEMGELAQALRRGDGDHLLEIFARAKTARDRYIDGILDSSE